MHHLIVQAAKYAAANISKEDLTRASNVVATYVAQRTKRPRVLRVARLVVSATQPRELEAHHEAD